MAINAVGDFVLGDSILVRLKCLDEVKQIHSFQPKLVGVPIYI